MLISKKERRNDISYHIYWYLLNQHFLPQLQKTQICQSGKIYEFGISTYFLVGQ